VLKQPTNATTGCHWRSTIYHGIPKNHLTPVLEPKEDYVAFLGRISPEKGVDGAVRIAEGAGVRLNVAAKIDDFDRIYYEKEIKHLFDSPHMEYIGEISEAERRNFWAMLSSVVPY
jgi:glycosyltransferase involved in cell wall biosynthesis